jgi:hypothetical protein
VVTRFLERDNAETVFRFYMFVRMTVQVPGFFYQGFPVPFGGVASGAGWGDNNTVAKEDLRKSDDAQVRKSVTQRNQHCYSCQGSFQAFIELFQECWWFPEV